VCRNSIRKSHLKVPALKTKKGGLREMGYKRWIKMLRIFANGGL
jgi:hypothetical protein